MMADQHPITPLAELVELWIAEVWHEGTPVRVAASDLHVATQAACWGADQELEACCEWLGQNCGRWELPAALRAARRPKPPSLKEQALAALDALPTPTGQVTADRFNIIRRALEALPE